MFQAQSSVASEAPVTTGRRGRKSRVSNACPAPFLALSLPLTHGDSTAGLSRWEAGTALHLTEQSPGPAWVSPPPRVQAEDWLPWHGRRFHAAR